MSHRRASTTSSISSFFDPSREIDSFASPVRGGMVFSEPHTSSSSSSRPPTSSSSSSARPPAATSAKKPTSSLTSSLNNAPSQPVVIAATATISATSAAVPIPTPPSSGGHSRNSSFSAGGVAPLAVSIPRQRSFSSSFSLATGGLPVSAGAPSPRTFTGSSMISNPGSFPGSANPFALGAFAPLSPTSSSPPGGSNSASASVSQSVPVLHRRFSSSFNQLNQIVSPTAQSTERGRRTSMFGGGSPPTSVSIQTASFNSTHIDTNNNSVSTMGSGLFRKFSTSRPVSTTSTAASTPADGAAAAGHPFDRNDAGPTVVVSPQPSSNQQQYSSMLPPPGTQDDGRHLVTAVDKLKPSYDKPSRSSSPMRSMILNGQMLD